MNVACKYSDVAYHSYKRTLEALKLFCPHYRNIYLQKVKRKLCHSNLFMLAATCKDL